MTNNIELTVSYKDEYGKEWYISNTLPPKLYHGKECLPDLLKTIGQMLELLL